jgi:homoserine dehydrogenase
MSAKNVSVAIIGVGLVGGEFISQLLSLPQPSPFRLVSISSSKYSLFSPTGLSFSSTGWKSDLSKSPFKPDFSDLTLKLGALAAEGHKVVLVDNTSSEEIARLYPTFLIAGFAVITPNKKAFSGELSLYESILDASSQSGSKVLNEATVGAGLPIISTLKDLVATGDKV